MAWGFKKCWRLLSYKKNGKGKQPSKLCSLFFALTYNDKVQTNFFCIFHFFFFHLLALIDKQLKTHCKKFFHKNENTTKLGLFIIHINHQINFNQIVLNNSIQVCPKKLQISFVCLKIN